MALKTIITTALAAEENATGDLRSGTIKTDLAKLSRTLADGSAINQANRLYADSLTLAALASVSLDLFDFGGAKDAQGQTYAIAKVKGIVIRNKSIDPTAILRVGGEGTGAAFNSVNGSDTVHIADIAPGGELVLLAPSAAGYGVTDVTNHLLKIANQSATVAVDCDVAILGAQ